MDGVKMRKTTLAVVAIALTMMTPVVWADHDPAPSGDEQPVDALLRMGTDGYVVVAERTGGQQFTVQVLHEGVQGLGAEPVKLLPDQAFDNAQTDEIVVENDATNRGVWLHGYDDLEVGKHPAQSLTFTRDAQGNQTMTVDILPATESTYSVIAIAPIVTGNSTSWVGGFHHPLQATVPLDILDAVPYPVNFYP